MIETLYPVFRKWSEKGSVYIVSDTHFEDSDCKLMDPHWIAPEEHAKIIKEKAHRNDTLIHLGDVGNPEWLKPVKAHKVLIMGNHDQAATKFADYFDEVYTGPLIIAEKIILSHEPIDGIDWAFNLHGHDHDPHNKGDNLHMNFASNVVGFQVFSLGDLIKSGILSNIKSLHRDTIDTATQKKEKRKKKG